MRSHDDRPGAGANLVTWTGPNGTPIAIALRGILDDVLAAFLGDPDARAYVIFNRRVPASLITAAAIDYPQGLWLIMADDVSWEQPAVSSG